ncbi:MAG: NADH-quinone oxidoreductase subunit N [Verrucomicrobia bacterium]|nr:NADH-quinone oxidoreductase subunit N [Verrucomicrobiota bacterium]
MNYTELFRAMIPEAALVAGALLVLTVDLLFGRKRSLETRLQMAVVSGSLAVVGAMYGAFTIGLKDPVFGGVLVLDDLALATRLGVLMLSWLTLTLSGGTARLRHPAEFVAIVLLATAGFTLMAAAQQLLVAFLALELASLSLYILAGFDKTRPESAEAALKYFLFGGMSAAFLLFGFSLIYGLTGSIELQQISAQLARQGMSPLLGVALVMVLVAFGFKAAAAPFHLWAPDVYEGAPVSSAALIASASKLAGFALFTRLLWPGFGHVAGSVATAVGSPGWLPIVACISAASLLLGNFAALAQSNVRRLLAYSAIAHAGVMLLAVISAGESVGPLYYYLLTYGLATIGAFGVIAVVERAGTCQKITDLAGLYRRSPLLSACLAIYILSLAGIPPLAGFFGKFTVFAAALKLGGLAGPAGWLTILAIALSAVALYYYLVVLKQALVASPSPSASGRIPVPADAAIVLIFTALLLVLLGIFPSVVLRIF